jgi:hypothetical protein
MRAVAEGIERAVVDSSRIELRPNALSPWRSHDRRVRWIFIAAYAVEVVLLARLFTLQPHGAAGSWVVVWAFVTMVWTAGLIAIGSGVLKHRGVNEG